MAFSLVTLEEAKAHLYVVDSARDDDILRKIEQASDSIYRFMDAQADAGWQDGSVDVPGAVRSAVFVLLTHLHENRGQDMKADEDVWKAIGRILAQMRDPALA